MKWLVTLFTGVLCLYTALCVSEAVNSLLLKLIICNSHYLCEAFKPVETVLLFCDLYTFCLNVIN